MQVPGRTPARGWHVVIAAAIAGAAVAAPVAALALPA